METTATTSTRVGDKVFCDRYQREMTVHLAEPMLGRFQIMAHDGKGLGFTWSLGMPETKTRRWGRK